MRNAGRIWRENQGVYGTLKTLRTLKLDQATLKTLESEQNVKEFLENLEKTLVSPKKPFTAIIGGAKISSKIAVIRNLLERVDTLIIGGAMSYTFIKALNGSVGRSLVENSKLAVAKNLIYLANKKGKKLVLPVDSVNAKSINNGPLVTSNIYEIDEHLMGLDIGVQSCNLFSKIIKSSKTIIWNGPMGVFEVEKFENGTKNIANSICEATKNGMLW